MILKEEVMDRVLKLTPAFKESWEAHLRYWSDEEPGLCNDMAALSRYIAARIANEHFDDLGGVFDLIELLLREGDQEVKDATATCFLENLANASSAKKIDANKFIHLLGPKSRAHWRAWDRFTGVCTSETQAEFSE
ncbi:MAG: hypothetical protein GF414_04315 [Candidatus Altiarchaeales archaeon]|nr:hypothetical protein [Candidatus Altiarchaeales archaeon]